MTEKRNTEFKLPGGPDDSADSKLLTRTIDGDREAFRALYAKYYHPLLRFMYRITGQLELAQEGINDVMLVVWSNGSSFSGRSKVSTWIMGIAYRKALKLLEKSRRWSDRVTSEPDFRRQGCPGRTASCPAKS